MMSPVAKEIISSNINVSGLSLQCHRKHKTVKMKKHPNEEISVISSLEDRMARNQGIGFIMALETPAESLTAVISLVFGDHSAKKLSEEWYLIKLARWIAGINTLCRDSSVKFFW